MIDVIRKGGLAPALLRRRTMGVALFASLLAASYWTFFASDRFVSEAHIIVQNTDVVVSQNFELSSLIGGMGGGASMDQLLLRDHLLSVDMLNKLDERLNLRAHYSGREHDLISRMWDADVPLEWFYRYYLSRVSVDYDEHAGVLVIKAQAYDADTAHAIAVMLVEEGGRFMNDMAHRLALEQVRFLEAQVFEVNKRVELASQAVLTYQNEQGLASPQETAENLVGIINGFEVQLAELRAQRGAKLAYLMEDSADIIELNQQIDAIEKQIASEKSRLTSSAGPSLNATVAEFERLQMAATFARDVYKTSLVALEQGRIEATRTLKQVSILQEPTQPQYPLEPRRLYNTVVFVLLTFLIAGIVQLIAAIIRDHKD